MGGIEFGLTRFVQFHPQYSYQDFIEGYSVSDGAFHYKRGVFLELIAIFPGHFLVGPQPL